MYSPRAVVLPAVFDQGHHTGALVYFANQNGLISRHLHFFLRAPWILSTMGSYAPDQLVAGNRHRLQLTAAGGGDHQRTGGKTVVLSIIYTSTCQYTQTYLALQ